eukprot:8396177-Karenia_brevis.AAC.1
MLDAFNMLLFSLASLSSHSQVSQDNREEWDQGQDSYEITGAEASLQHEIASAQACANRDQLQRSVAACEKGPVHHDTTDNAKSSKGLEYACTVANRFDALSSDDDDDADEAVDDEDLCVDKVNQKTGALSKSAPPTHVTSNPCTGKVFTVEMHRQRAEI